MKLARFILCPLALLSVLALAAGPPPPGPHDADRLVAVDDFDHALLAGEIFRVTNEVRLQQGVGALRPEPSLTAAANGQAAMLSIRLHSGHDNPLANQGDPSARVRQAGLPVGTVAENAASLSARNRETGRNYTYAELATVIVQAWMDSPGHRSNLLNPTLHYLGCGTRAAWLLGNPVVYAIQDFYAPALKNEPPPPSLRPGATNITR